MSNNTSGPLPRRSNFQFTFEYDNHLLNLIDKFKSDIFTQGNKIRTWERVLLEFNELTNANIVQTRTINQRFQLLKRNFESRLKHDGNNEDTFNENETILKRILEFMYESGLLSESLFHKISDEDKANKTLPLQQQQPNKKTKENEKNEKSGKGREKQGTAKMSPLTVTANKTSFLDEPATNKSENHAVSPALVGQSAHSGKMDEYTRSSVATGNTLQHIQPNAFGGSGSDTISYFTELQEQNPAPRGSNLNRFWNSDLDTSGKSIAHGEFRPLAIDLSNCKSVPSMATSQRYDRNLWPHYLEPLISTYTQPQSQSQSEPQSQPQSQSQPEPHKSNAAQPGDLPITVENLLQQIVKLQEQCENQFNIINGEISRLAERNTQQFGELTELVNLIISQIPSIYEPPAPQSSSQTKYGDGAYENRS